MADTIDWVVVERFGKQIGAVGFVGDQASVVVAFYDDYDADKSGKVSWGEWTVGKLSPLSLKGNAVVEVAMQARYDMNIMTRDPSFQTMSANLYLNFAKGLIADGIYAAYFSRGVSAVATPIAGRLAQNMVVQFAIRKGMESTVKKVYDTAVK